MFESKMSFERSSHYQADSQNPSEQNLNHIPTWYWNISKLHTLKEDNVS